LRTASQHKIYRRWVPDGGNAWIEHAHLRVLTWQNVTDVSAERDSTHRSCRDVVRHGLGGRRAGVHAPIILGNDHERVSSRWRKAHPSNL
jgi:hypothetical protein